VEEAAAGKSRKGRKWLDSEQASRQSMMGRSKGCITKAGAIPHQSRRKKGQFSNFFLCITKISQELLPDFVPKPVKYDPW